MGSAGRGAKGHRLDDWVFIRLDDRDPYLVARVASAGCRCAASPRPVSGLLSVGRHAQAYWPPWSGSPGAAGGWIEERFPTGKALVGQDLYPEH